MSKIVAIIGPTGSGKSSLGERLARECPGEIISCDSVQVYRGFNIGTSKPPVAIQQEIPHHLVNVVNAHEPFHAGLFAKMADAAIADVASRGNIPLIVGGTGLYLRALLHGLSPAPKVPDEVRAALELDLKNHGLEALYQELHERDPEWAAQLPATDTQRILRGLEVARGTGLRLSELNKAHQFAEQRYECRMLAIPHERDVLYNRINQRVLDMMDEGLLHEVETLLSDGIPKESKPMQAPGYLQLVQYLEGQLSLEEAVSLIQQSHRRYAKRQMTWLKKTEGVEWVNPEEVSADDLRAWVDSGGP